MAFLLNGIMGFMGIQQEAPKPQEEAQQAHILPDQQEAALEQQQEASERQEALEATIRSLYVHLQTIATDSNTTTATLNQLIVEFKTISERAQTDAGTLARQIDHVAKHYFKTQREKPSHPEAMEVRNKVEQFRAEVEELAAPLSTNISDAVATLIAREDYIARISALDAKCNEHCDAITACARSILAQGKGIQELKNHLSAACLEQCAGDIALIEGSLNTIDVASKQFQKLLPFINQQLKPFNVETMALCKQFDAQKKEYDKALQIYTAKKDEGDEWGNRNLPVRLNLTIAANNLSKTYQKLLESGAFPVENMNRNGVRMIDEKFIHPIMEDGAQSFHEIGQVVDKIRDDLTNMKDTGSNHLRAGQDAFRKQLDEYGHQIHTLALGSEITAHMANELLELHTQATEKLNYSCKKRAQVRDWFWSPFAWFVSWFR